MHPRKQYSPCCITVFVKIAGLRNNYVMTLINHALEFATPVL